MIGLRKYKTTITAILLAVYAFIATPVPLWHHHNYDVNAQSEKTTKEKVLSVLKSALQSTDTNCQICSHHYSVYNDVANIIFEIPSLILPSNKECYIFSIPLSPLLNISNKGPPSVA